MPNSLIHSASPYLLQHAHNPVDWNEWNDEILQKAKDENKPILVSIGYSACHWCHVMERESFENEDTAAVMNKHFINIKIDREERPDLDNIYMDALQAMTGSGGWPLNVFLTPELKPFFGGTYFPPKPAHGRSSWIETLLAVSNAFKERKDEVELQAEKLLQHLQNSNRFGEKNSMQNDTVFTKENLELISQNILKNADVDWGGFGNAPKFPQTFSIQYLLRHYHFTKNENALKQALLSIDKMIMGGIYDHVGGGFARYSTDEKWLAPHFEKMLYDNALLVSVISEAYQITKDPIYKNVIIETLNFVERELMNENFGFYSALDADSEGVEGKFYTWSIEEIYEILGENAPLFCTIYDIQKEGNWEHTNIIWLKQTIENYASSNNLNIDELNEKLSFCKKLLFDLRAKRIRPSLDDKILLSWNTLMNIAYCKAYEATQMEHYKEIAIKNMQFINDNLIVMDKEYHCFSNNKAYNAAFLDDYAYLCLANIHLQEITGSTTYLLKANFLMHKMIDLFSDGSSGLFFYSPIDQKNIIVRKKEVYDGATPSGNAIAVICLNYLSKVFFNEIFYDKFRQAISSLSAAIIKHPTSFACWANALQIDINNFKEVAIVGDTENSILTSILANYHPNKILVSSDINFSASIPFLKDKMEGEITQIYLCQNNTCLPPKIGVEEFLLFYNK